MANKMRAHASRSLPTGLLLHNYVYIVSFDPCVFLVMNLPKIIVDFAYVGIHAYTYIVVRASNF